MEHLITLSFGQIHILEAAERISDKTEIRQKVKRGKCKMNYYEPRRIFFFLWTAANNLYDPKIYPILAAFKNSILTVRDIRHCPGTLKHYIWLNESFIWWFWMGKLHCGSTPREEMLLPQKNAYLFPHDISGLHDAARGEAMVSGQQDGLLQCHAQGAAVGQR